MSDKQKPHVDQLEEDDEFEEFDQVRVLQGLRIRGLQFYTVLFLNFIRKHTENDRYWQKKICHLFAKCLKILPGTVFSHLHLQIAKSAIMTPK
jgi:hypothetical protein